MSRPAPARRAAARALTLIDPGGAFADRALEAEADRAALAPRDAALATEIVLGVLRWRRYLDALLAPHARRRLQDLDPRLLNLLRMTAYQIVFLERVPSWAAVNDAVSLARAVGDRGGPEFVNAVLRALSRSGPAGRRPVLPADPLESLAVRCSFPTWIAARWVERYGPEEAERLMLAMNERPPLTLRVNTLRTTRDRARDRLAREDGLRAEPTRLAPEGLVVEHGGAPGRWQTFTAGEVVPQDEAAMLVSRLLEPAPGETVADVCAAPGTKTTHLAALMSDSGRVIAIDRDGDRLALLAEATRRLGVSIVEPRTGAVADLAPAFAGACDRVLVDAPCTNLGVLRRRPEVKWRRGPEDLLGAQSRQREILAAAAAMVRPGGRLVYATCSLEPEENEAVMAEFLAARPEWRPERPADGALPLDAAGVLRCWPSRHGTDGFTAIRLRRIQ
jgi:16S rRNA (cytosine967-C5)-methyltransferase